MIYRHPDWLPGRQVEVGKASPPFNPRHLPVPANNYGDLFIWQAWYVNTNDFDVEEYQSMYVRNNIEEFEGGDSCEH